MKKNKKVLGILGIILAIGLLFYFSGGSNLFFVITGTEEVKLAIPHMASYKCEPIGDKYGIAISIPKEGGIISKETVGFYTNGISNIKLSFTNSYWSTDWATRGGYAVCDTNGYNCGAYTYITDWVGGQSNLPITSIDLTTNSLKLIYQRIPFYLIGGWQNSEGLKVTFDGKNFGLRLYATTRDPAGAKICTTSCNLDCPDIGYRQKLLFTDKTKLGFYETAPYLEYWETIDYDLNKQGEATIYNSSTNKFCFAGAIYTGSQLKMDNGVTYIYPDTNTRQNKVCCIGATISSTYSDLVCQSDYTWKVIQDTDKLTCMSDYNCPSQGGETCQNKILSGYHCKNKDSNNVGVCIKETGKSVQCCVNGDCVKDQVCDIYTHTCKGGTTLPVCGDGKLDAGEQCDDGNLKSGDGCTSICELEVEYCISHPEDPICGLGKCADCDAFALNKIFGETGILKTKTCKPTLLALPPQTYTTCFLSFIKFALIPLVFIFALLFGKGLFMSIGAIKKNEIVSWMLAGIVASILSYLIYALFWAGVFIFIFYIILKVVIKAVLK